jgi:diadenosine tetraphosphatase ApaH/serine/threonine PP2A family protein phosphatase
MFSWSYPVKAAILLPVRCAIVADIHANLAAFTAVMADIRRRGGVEVVWCLGDIVDYGPDPHQCIELLCQYDHVCIIGNHDLAAIGKIDTSAFNPDAALACEWTARQLSPEDADYLNNRPSVIKQGDFTLAHGSPRDHIWEYLLSSDSAQENFACFKSQFCLVGHSHIPLVFGGNEAGAYPIDFPAEAELVLAESRLIINPGSVGQPRDGDFRASYAIYNSAIMTVTHYRDPYDVALTQARMMKHGLPKYLVTRLSYGI